MDFSSLLGAVDSSGGGAAGSGSGLSRASATSGNQFGAVTYGTDFSSMIPWVIGGLVAMIAFGVLAIVLIGKK